MMRNPLDLLPETAEEQSERLARLRIRNYQAHNAWVSAETSRILDAFKNGKKVRP